MDRIFIFDNGMYCECFIYQYTESMFARIYLLKDIIRQESGDLSWVIPYTVNRKAIKNLQEVRDEIITQIIK